ncbi:peptidase U32 family protein [Psychrobacillus lasiicapitis]|uniref:U32 family peptidase n=1 Tax=Psychrobacillus lasiicapitis TaxID=1636719 RepID=A0A544T9X9_9BACI|nr:peptidase U32 family protein [Psychrobacillus lasiicapitis]TQR14265.1 U32 family peptidase [Psychrobacillus lasiicapitis]GGA32768.1 collagenase [Psychrobacillus lasiicapitis]
MKKTELLVTPASLEHLDELITAGADAFLIGEQFYGLRLGGEFTIEDIKVARKRTKEHNKKLYVALNGLFHNDKVDALAPYMQKLQEIGVDGITFGDPAVIIARREAEVTIPLHWSTEQTATNYFTANYWGKRGANRAVLARELSLEEIVEIKENADVQIEVQVHGMTCMFQSKRSLLGNYFLFQDKAMEIENRSNHKNMFLHDKERGNKYPIYEDQNGTHIFSPNDICMIDELDELLDAEVDSLKIDGILHDPSYVTAITGYYRQAIDAYYDSSANYKKIKKELFNKIKEIQPPLRPLDTGFFFKETVY